MSQRQADLFRIRDLLEHLQSCQDQLEWCEDASTVHYLTETMLRDLETCRRLCVSLHRRARLEAVN